jgi:hypothetical protein
MALSFGRSLRVGGTATAFSNELTTKLVANTVYQITDATKRVLDLATTFTVQVDPDGGGGLGWSTAAAGTYTIDHLFGKVTFLSDQGASALVRVSGNYLPTVAVAKVRESNMTITRDAPDASTHETALYRERLATLVDVSGSFTSLELAQYDHDAGAGVFKFITLLQSGAPFLYEERPGSAGDYFRAWVLVTGLEHGGAVSDLNSLTVNWTGASQRTVNNTGPVVAVGWGP